MHRLFPQWYRLVSVDATAQTLTARWQAVEEIGSSVDATAVRQLVRFALGRNAAAASYRETVEGYVQTADATYLVGGGDTELSVLAGATLAHLIESGLTAVADYASLSVTSAFAQGLRDAPVVQDLLPIAGSYLRKRSAELRANWSWPDLPKGLGELKAAPSSITGDPSGFVRELGSSLSRLGEATAALSTATGTQVKSLLEMTEVTWWILGEYSRDLDKPVSALPGPAVPLIVGKELGDLVRVLPGPLSGVALLHRMLRVAGRKAEKDLAVADAINACPREWRAEWVGTGSDDIDDVTPLVLAVQKSLDVDDAQQWQPIAQTACAIDLGQELKPLSLAAQVYNEAMCRLARAELEGETSE